MQNDLHVYAVIIAATSRDILPQNPEWFSIQFPVPATWPLKRKTVLALHRAEIRVIRCMCDVKLRDKLSCVELRQRLRKEDVMEVVQRNRLRRHGPVLNNDDDCVKKIRGVDPGLWGS